MSLATASTALTTVAGIAIIALVLRDLLHTLLHPIGRGAMSRAILRGGWRLFRAWARDDTDRLSLAGPLLMVTVIAIWFALLVTGWALIYWPHMPEGFWEPAHFTLEQRSGFPTALYYSIVTIATLGYGEFTATTNWLRFASGIQGVVGFVLLTASITWVLSVFPVLTRQRSLAHTVALLRRTAEQTGRDPLALDDDESLALLRTLSAQVVLTESDLAHFSIAYYFTERERRASLSGEMSYVLALARSAQGERRAAAVRFQGALLEGTVDDFARTVHESFLPHVHPATTERVLDEYARDHGCGEEGTA